MTDTITIPRALLEQVLEALEHEAEIGNDDAYREERDALRTALEQPQQDSKALKRYAGSHCPDSCGDCKYSGRCLDEAEMEQQEKNT